MLGPEAIPYGSIGSYADTLSKTHDLSPQQTMQLLINDIPRRDLGTVCQQVYEQTAPLADKPDDPGYHAALKSVAWGRRLESNRRLSAASAGEIGAIIGGTIGTAAEAAYGYHSYNEGLKTATAQPSSPAEGASTYIEDVGFLGSVIAPVLVAGAIGAAVGRRFGPQWATFQARRDTKRILAAKADPTKTAPKHLAFEDMSTMEKIAETRYRNRAAREQLEDSSSAKDDEPALPYQTAKAAAHANGCKDEQQYADFLLANTPPKEVTQMLWETKSRLRGIVAGTGELTPQDPAYGSLMHDIQIVDEITQRRSEAAKPLRRLYTALGYIGTLCYMASPTLEATDIAYTNIPYSIFFAGIGVGSVLTGLVGRTSGMLLPKRADVISQKRAQRRLARVSGTTGPGPKH